MATRLEDILIRVRDTLADENAERFSDDRLVRLADDAQKLIALHTDLLKSKADINIAVGVANHTLPANIRKITRVLNEDGNPIAFLNHEQADALYGKNWEATVGSPLKAIIYDKTDQSIVKVYPIPDGLAANLSAELLELNNIYGVTAAGGFASAYDLMNSPYGVLASVQSVTTLSFAVYYLRVATTLLTKTDTLEIHSSFDQAMKFYITGMALRDDKDTHNSAVGKEELAFFRGELKAAKKAGSGSATSQGKQYVVPYSGGFDT